MQQSKIPVARPQPQDDAGTYSRDDAVELFGRLNDLASEQKSRPETVIADLRALDDAQLIDVLCEIDPHILMQAIGRFLPGQTGAVPAASAAEAAAEIDESENRRTKRKRTLRLGKIIYNNRMCVLDCGIKDVSDDGCRVGVASSIGVPNIFQLNIQGDDAVHECEVMWRVADEMGLSFLK